MKTNRKYRLSMFIVSASLLLASCSIDDIFDKHSDSADSAGAVTTDGSIAFHPDSLVTKSGNGDGWQTVNVPLGSSDKASQQATTAVATRGAYVSGTGAPAGSFGVLGYLIKSGGNISSVAPSSFMYNTQVTRNGVSGSYTYTYNPKKYWPDNTSDMVRFFAYYPYNGDGITLPAATDTGFPVLTYSPSTTVANQVDLMHVAAPAAVNNKIVGTAVGLNFSHALTRVSFSVKKDASLASNAVVVKSIRLSGIKSKGYLPLGFSWTLSTVATDTTSYTSSVTDGTLIPAASQSLNTSSYQLVNSYNGYQLLLPQTVSNANKMAITYTIDGVYKSVECTLPSATWGMGQSINYQITLLPLLGTSTNCYILNPSASTSKSFLFPVSRVNEYWNNGSLGNNGTYAIGASDTWKMVIIWQDVPNLVTIYGATGTGFTGPASYATVSIPANAYGNAVVGIMKTSGSGTLNTILWSWHLWVTGYNPTTTTMSYNGLTWLDRNLGAMNNGLGADAYGLYYQWGRKDPFPGSTSGSIATSTTYGNYPVTMATGPVSLATSIGNPNKFYTGSSGNYDWLSPQRTDLWYNSGKTIYDPCPDGWHIPLNTQFISNVAFTSNNTPSGYWDFSGNSMNLLGYKGVWWSSVTYNTDAYYLNSGSYVTNFPRAGGFSVRCVKQ
jgi:hypothetical protein